MGNRPNIFLSRADFARELTSVWRVIAVLLAFQFVAGIAAMLLGRIGHPFVDYWFGGAVASTPGFLCGILWQRYGAREGLVSHSPILLFVGALSVLITIAGLTVPFERLVGDSSVETAADR